MKKELIIILGPTAVGKTDVSINIAQTLDTEIISFDSRQFYKELVIGTAPPNKEQLEKISHHFIHHISIEDEYNAGIYEDEVIKKIKNLFKKHDKLIAVGGSGLYLDAICKGFNNIPSVDKEVREIISKRYHQEGIKWLKKELKEKDPSYFKIVDENNPRRIIRALEVIEQTGKTYSSFRSTTKKERLFKIQKIGLNMQRSELYNRINKRVDKMMEKGLLNEVRELRLWKKSNPLQTVGYRELFNYLENKCNLEDAIEEIKRNTRRLAKRQLTWFRKDVSTHWVNTEETKKIIELIEV